MPEDAKFNEEDLLQLFSAMANPAPAPAAPAIPAAASPAAPAPAAPSAPVPAVPPPAAAAPPPMVPPPPVQTPPAPLPAAAEQAAVPAAPAGVSPADLERVDDLGHQFEIGRVRMEQVLVPFITEKVTKKMLAWSLERIQKGHPILKNVHWNPDGDLSDNGMIDVDRLKRNAEGMQGQNVVVLAKAALFELLNMRLSAVEQGLGASMRQAVGKEVAKLGELLR